MNTSAAKKHLLKLQRDLEKREQQLQATGALVVPGSMRKFDLKTIEAIKALIHGPEPKRSKRLTKKALKLLDEAGCNEIGDAHVILGTTDLRILLSDEAIEDLNAQAREMAEFN